ncbi:MAG: prealbumin-like fold domain-containing protein, partial [Clostridia bacterium]|nr:prealbumin-like fold domain-containing protein [Clostridia bacterium]
SVNTGKFLSGATLELIRVSNGEIVEEWISDSGYKVFPQLEVGERYVLHERFAPDGYMKAEPIVFVVTGEGATIIELENEMQPTLETKARFESGFKYELAKGEITLIDKVMYYQ